MVRDIFRKIILQEMMGVGVNKKKSENGSWETSFRAQMNELEYLERMGEKLK